MTPAETIPPLLRVTDLALSFGAGPHAIAAVDGVSFAVARGRTLGIVGESGSGKSATCMALAGLLPRTSARITRGSAWLGDVDLLRAPETVLCALRGRRIGMVFQDPFTALNPYLPVGEQVAEPLRIHGLATGAQARARALQALEEVGIPDPARRGRDYPHEFSGGQRQRILIAMAIIAQPDLLIADEPTTALDVTVQAQILALLARLQQQHGMALVFVSHDLDVVAGIADDVLVMQQGRAVECGSVGDVLGAPRAGYTRQLIDARPRGRAARTPVPEPRVPLLQVEGLCVRHGRPAAGRDSVASPVLHDIHLAIAPGEILGLVGETGSGKSTLARALMRLVRSDSGRVRIGGMDWSGMDADSLRHARPDVQMVFQDPYASLNPRLTVYQCLAEALRAWRARPPGPTLQDAVAALLADVGLPADAAHRHPHAFSGGQRQRIAIARALAPEPRLLIADEPVSALDVTVQAQILDLLLDLAQGRGLAMLFISHDLAVIRRIADRVAVLHAGRIVETGTTDEVFAAPAHAYTRELLASVPAALVRARNFDSHAAMRE